MARLVLQVTGSPSEIVHEALPVDDPKVRQPDITRAQQVLGWEPRISLRQGIRPTYEWIEKRVLLGGRLEASVIAAE